MKEYLKIHEKDNVLVAIKEIAKGEKISIDNKEILVSEVVPAGHKMTISPIQKGEEVIKYGSCIGTAREDLQPGQWVHTHNVKTALGDLLEYTYHPMESVLTSCGKATDSMENGRFEAGTFMGYRRSNGKVGIRNDVWIIPTVGCVNAIGSALAKSFNAGLKEDKVIPFRHPYGCSQMGEDEENTRKVLADLINHPNAGAVLVLGLGCENSNIDVLKKYIGVYDDKRVRFMVCQEAEDEMEAGTELLEELVAYAEQFQRQEIPASELVVGLKCGGSDGFSGITANPVVGKFSDLLIRQGGTTILTEVPEMFGAETFLMNRCENEALFQETVQLINDFKQYYKDNNQTIYENPSPGNKKGGITTLEDKSLGCVQKSGSAPVKGVLSYGEPVAEHGLNLLCAPGNDLVAATALAASGAHMVLFTTGRGTPFASPVPTVKISSNSGLAGHKKNWIDFNAGVLVEDKNMEEVANELFAYVIAVASGQQVCSEKAGLQDMAIFKKGVTL